MRQEEEKGTGDEQKSVFRRLANENQRGRQTVTARESPDG